MKASDLFVKALENEGVEYIFGLPGEENLDLLESLRKSKKIKLVVTRHEQAAGFMAATYGRLTGKVGVALSTLGPGATNFLTASAYAQLGAMPMLMITGQKPIKKIKQGLFQIVDIPAVYSPITKRARQMTKGDDFAREIHEAFTIALTERPGAVLLELPEDVAREDTSSEIVKREKLEIVKADENSIIKAVELLEKAKSPLVLFGSGAQRKQASSSLTDFITKSGIPFFNTQMGKGAVDERHDLHLGTTALSGNDFIHCAIKRADVILNIGHDVIEAPPFLMTKGDRRTVIHLNYFSAQKVVGVYTPQLEIVGDIKDSVLRLSEKLTLSKNWDFSYFMSLKKKLNSHLEEKTDSDKFPMLPQRIVTDVRSVMDDNDIVTLDNGMYKLWFGRYYETRNSNTLLLDNTLATMGVGLPSAMAVKMIYPGKKVLTVVGDGGFMMNSQELETAIRLGLDLVVLLLNDNAYGMIKWKQDKMGFKSFGLDYKNPDFVKYAQSYGAKGYRVEKVEDLVKYMKKSFSQGGVSLIEVPIDYSENKRVFNDELKELTCDL